MEPNHTCPKCQTVSPATSFFCSNCGHQLRKKPISISVGKQIGIYLISFFLPPFGLHWGIPLLLQPGTKSKIVGSIVIVLTTISLYISIKIFLDLLQVTTGQLNQINSLGY